MATPLLSKAKGLPFKDWPSDEQDQYLADQLAPRRDDK